MDKVSNDPEIKFMNVRRSGFDNFMQRSYVLFDTISLGVIIALLISSRRSGAAQGGGMGMMPNKAKKF